RARHGRSRSLRGRLPGHFRLVWSWLQSYTPRFRPAIYEAESCRRPQPNMILRAAASAMLVRRSQAAVMVVTLRLRHKVHNRNRKPGKSYQIVRDRLPAREIGFTFRGKRID